MTVALPTRYASWQARIAEEFFANRVGIPIVMFVDRNMLEELAAAGEDGPRSLAAAVAELVDIGAGKSMFGHIEAAEADWSKNTARDQPPPTLPVLALSALAASEMCSDGNVAATNYYVPLARSMLPDGTESDILSLRHSLREGKAFKSVAEMWANLHHWLTTNSGQFGMSTIQEHDRHSRIGYPLSQTLVRRSDRAALTKFFDKLRQAGPEVPSPESLLELTRIWAKNRPQGLTKWFIRSLDDPDLVDYVKTVVHALATNWDGVVITAEGLRPLDIRMVLDVDRHDSWWAIRQVDGVSEDLLRGEADDQPFEALITKDAHTGLYQHEGFPNLTAGILANGLIARGTSCVAEFDSSPITILLDNAHAGGWMSVDAPEPYEDHVFLVSSELSDTVEGILREAATPGWKTLSTAPFKGVLNGYKLISGISFSDQKKLYDALAKLPIKIAAKFRTSPVVRPRLVNGLRLMSDIAPHTYIEGGEPDLALPGGAEERRTPVTLDGRSEKTNEQIEPFPQTQEFLASIFPIPLSRPKLEPGNYIVTADGFELHFTVVSGSFDDRQTPGTGRLAWRGAALEDSSPYSDVCGAAVTGVSSERPSLAKRGASQTWLIEPSGRFMQCEEPPPPEFFSDVRFPMFELVSDDAAFVAQQFRIGWKITVLNEFQPQFAKLTGQDQVLWRQLAEANVSEDRLWGLYCDEWRRSSAR